MPCKTQAILGTNQNLMLIKLDNFPFEFTKVFRQYLSSTPDSCIQLNDGRTFIGANSPACFYELRGEEVLPVNDFSPAIVKTKEYQKKFALSLNTDYALFVTPDEIHLLETKNWQSVSTTLTENVTTDFLNYQGTFFHSLTQQLWIGDTKGVISIYNLNFL